MVFLAMALSVLLIGFGLWGIVSPATLLAFLSRWQTREGLWAGAALRLIFGLALWFCCPPLTLPNHIAGRRRDIRRGGHRHAVHRVGPFHEHGCLVAQQTALLHPRLGGGDACPGRVFRLGRYRLSRRGGTLY